MLDVDCDGRPELVTSGVDAAGAPVWRIFRFSPGGWTEISSPAFALPFSALTPDAGIRTIDLNGDGCHDLLVSTAAGGRYALLATAAGWQSAPHLALPFDLVDAAGNDLHAVIGDLDADGRQDIFGHVQTPGGSPVSFAYRQEASGWNSLPAPFIPPLLHSQAPNAPSAAFFIGDVNDDGFADILLPSGNPGSFGRIFTGSVNGFIAKPDYAPPIAFSRRERSDGGIRFVDLNADGLPDIVYSREITRNGVTTKLVGAYINRGGYWEASPGLHPPHPLAADFITGTPVQFVDVDGDGFIDLLYSYRRRDGSQTTAYFRNEPVVTGQREPRHWVHQPGSGLTPPTNFPFAEETTGDLGVRFVDINGDGRIDLLVGIMPTGLAQNVEFCSIIAGNQVCQLDRSAFQVAAFINDGNSWVRAPQFDPPVPFVARSADHLYSDDLFIQLVDVDGDRLPDIVASFRHPWKQDHLVREVWLNTRAGWQLSGDHSLPNLANGDPLLLDELRRNPRVFAQWVDLNGDGLTDIVLSHRDGASNFSQTWFSTGRGFVDAPAMRLPLDALSDRPGDPAFRFIDVNGDGFPDILYSRQDASGGIQRGLLVNNGRSWIQNNVSAAANVPPFIDSDGYDLGVRLIDIDGNGLADVVRSFAAGSDILVPETVLLLNTARRTDILQSYTAGYGLEVSIQYQTLMEANADGVGGAVTTAAPWARVYEPGVPVGYPVVSPVPAAYVVRRVVIDEGGGRSSGFSYRYGDFRVHALASRSLGFAWRESYNETSGMLSRTEVMQDVRARNPVQRQATCRLRLRDMPAGTPVSTNLCPTGPAMWAPWAQRINETENVWAVVEGSVGAGPAPLRRLRQVNLASTTARTFGLDGFLIAAQTDTLTYDNPPNVLDRRLNLLRSRTERMDGTSIETVNEYAQDDTARWFFGRLTRSEVTSVGDLIDPNRPERWTETRSTLFTYDPLTGLLSQTVTDPDHEKAITTRTERDRFGNIVASTVSVAGEPSRTVRTEFDPLGRFSVSDTNALGHRVQRRLRLTTGTPESTTDPNGRTATLEYDGFGRPIRETSPTGIAVSRTRLTPSSVQDPAIVAGLAAAFVVQTQVASFPPTFEVFDNKGRRLRVVTNGFTTDGSGSRPIVQDFSYDALGRLVATSVPRDRSSAPLWASTEYDALDRPILARAPDGSRSIRTYRTRSGGGSETILTDARGRMTMLIANTRGQTVGSLDPQGGTTRHSYDAGGRLVMSVGPTGATTRHRYDGVGHRVESQDPDLGVWRYRHDAFGRIVSQTDALGLVMTIEYDILDRPIRRIQPDGTSTSQYDTAPNGVGQLAALSNSEGYREEYQYDGFGRPVRRGVTIGREQFVTTTDFDPLGRITRISYPTGVSVENVFDRNGFHVGVRDGLSGHMYWTASNIDALGRVVEEKFGNGLVGTRAFNVENGRPVEFRVVGPKQTETMHLTLAYDLVGNLTQRQESSARISETFEYDALDRLTGRTSRGGSRDQYAFDAAGRMTFRSGVGDYTYGPGDPAASSPSDAAVPFHAVLRTQNGNSRADYSYDRNGNMVSAPGFHYEYTSDNRLSLLFANQSRWTRFEYAPGGQRYRQFARVGPDVTETLYIGSYERITEFAGPLSPARIGRHVRHRYNLVNASGVFASIETSTEYADALVRQAAERSAAQANAATASRPRQGQAGQRAAPPASTDERAAERERAQALYGSPRSAFEVRKTWYLHRDQLGSVIRISDDQARTESRIWYDPWGARTATYSTGGPRHRPGEVLAGSWDRGFTGHEHLDAFNVIHMNGRVYNTKSAAFMSVDIVNQSMFDSQTSNGYHYARNNPLRFTDPSGYVFAGTPLEGLENSFNDGLKGLGQSGSEFLKGVGTFFSEHWREIVVVAVVVAVTYFLGPEKGMTAGEALRAAIITGATTGAAGGAVSAWLYGGDTNDVLAAGAKGAVTGAWTAGAFYGVGDAFAGGYENSAGAVAAHGVVGGVSEAAQGGNFVQGFAAASFTKYSSRWTFSSYGADLARAAVVGGTVAALSGGKFANGAFLAVFSYTFNDYLHFDGATLEWRADGGQVLDSWQAIAGQPTHQNWIDQFTPELGPLPEGTYTALQTRYQEIGSIGRWDRIKGFFGRGSFPGLEKAWGSSRVWLEPSTRGMASGVPQIIRRDIYRMSIHGGSTPGSRGCIDLCGGNDAFMRRFRSHGQDMELIVRYPYR